MAGMGVGEIAMIAAPTILSMLSSSGGGGGGGQGPGGTPPFMPGQVGMGTLGGGFGSVLGGMGNQRGSGQDLATLISMLSGKSGGLQSGIFGSGPPPLGF